MNLLAPAFLLGLLGLALPLAAHVLGRPTPQDVPFAAIRFLPASEPVVRQRKTLRDRALLALRLFVLALVVLIFARPTLPREGSLQVVSAVHDAVLLLDASGSMALRIDDERELERALDRANAILDALPPGSRIALRTTDPHGPTVELTAEPNEVRRALEDWSSDDAPAPGAWRLGDAVGPAARMLASTGDRPRVIYVIGDATPDGLGSVVAPPGNIQQIAVATSELPIPEHWGVTAARWEPAPDLGSHVVRVHAVVHRHVSEPADDDAREATLALRIAGAEVMRATVAVPPNADVDVVFTPSLTSEDATPAEIALLDPEADPLSIDDRRFLWLSPERALEVTVVNGDPSELRAHDELFFLNTAVSASQTTGPIRIATRSLAPDQLEAALRERGKAALEDIDVLVLANVRAPAPDVAQALVEAVSGGMGLFVTVGDRIDAKAYNASLEPLLPLMMRDAIQVGTAPGRAEALVEGLAPPVLTHPIFRQFTDSGGLEGTRARKVVLLEPDARRTYEVAMSFTSGAPALITRQVGRGRVALLTTSIDRDWADLPLRPGFVPLALGTLTFLGDASSNLTPSAVEVGASVNLHTTDAVVVTAPDGTETTVSPATEGTSHFRDTFVPGHYRVRHRDTTSTVFVVDVAPRESAITRVVDDDDATASTLPRQDVAQPQWRWLVVLALAALAAESILRRRASRRRASSRP